MTDKEKEKLLNAFEIPDPDRKKQFAYEFRKRTPEKVRKPLFPIIIKTVASAAMLALVIGAITRLPKHEPDMYRNTDSVAVTTDITSSSVSSQTTEENSAAVTTTADKKGVKKTTSVTQTVSTNAAKTDEKKTVTTEAENNNENNEPDQPERTTRAHTTKPHTSRTTASHDIPHHTSTSTKPAPQQLTTVTTDTPGISGAKEENGDNDMTVELDVTYNIRSEILTVKDLVPGSDKGVGDGNDSISPVGAPVEQMIKQLYNDSYDVILAKVDKIVYTSIDGEPYTAENLTVDEVFKGSLNNNDKITLFVSGGYMSAEDYIRHHKFIFLPDAESYSIFDDGGCRGKEYVGDTYLFFIKETESSEFPSGSYELVTPGDTAIFRQSGDSYVSMHDDWLSLDISSLY
ncbi:MAG: hypothetical protein K5898_02510 [Ruminococcus sp.]|uniref:hypothetical protein n=1 Tax=Ruminococcus sp. TaxID=41978 RepID=UPI0025F9F703|nr:hypothetical protein [Ruminococcus sp.]MCR4794040.1 hypothetical protein [Ruminococcus sp.]